jgi:hypothetical protein
MCLLLSFELGKWAIMYLCVRDIDFAYFYDLSIGYWNCPRIYKNRESTKVVVCLRTAWRYQRGNQKLVINLRTDNAMDKRKKDKRTSNGLRNTENEQSNYANPTKTMYELRCSGRVNSSYSTRVIRVTNSVISHKWGKDLITWILCHG